MSELDIYLTLDGQAFIAPEYSIWTDSRQISDWSCPDFVVLDFRHKQLVIVEETTASRPAKLIGKIWDRGEQWYNRLSRYMVEHKITPENWHIRCLIVLRSTLCQKYKNQFIKEPDVSFLALENCTFPWEFHDQRIKQGIFGNERVSPMTVGEWASQNQTTNTEK